MGREKRPWGIVAGPVVLVLGLGVFWGAKSAMAVKDQVGDWGHQFEHSSEPVHMNIPSVPVISRLYVNGDRIGRIDEIVVQRSRPSSVDSLTVVASVDRKHLNELEDCNLRLRVRTLDEKGFTRALRCTRDTDNLTPFGHLEISGTQLNVPIFVRVGDLPCDEVGFDMGPCGVISDDLRSELQELERELADQADHIRIELKNGTAEVRQELERARVELRRARTEVRARIRQVR